MWTKFREINGNHGQPISSKNVANTRHIFHTILGMHLRKARKKRHAISIPYAEHARSAHEIVLLWEIVYCMLTNIVG
jgi:hypothetical protein